MRRTLALWKVGIAKTCLLFLTDRAVVDVLRREFELQVLLQFVLSLPFLKERIKGFTVRKAYEQLNTKSSLTA